MSIKQLNIAGRTITIRSTSDEEHLNEVAAVLSERILDTQTHIPDSSQALLFVALALTDELLTAHQRISDIEYATKSKLDSVLRALEVFELREHHN